MYISIQLEDEVFKPLKYNQEVFEKYQISNYGTIVSKRSPEGLKPFIDKDGYETVTLYRKDGSKKLCRVNRLVAYNFIEEVDDPEMVVNHLDNKKTNNYYENLEWSTQKSNVNHAIVHGNFDKHRLKRHVSKTYDKSYIETLCQYIVKYNKTKIILDKLGIFEKSERRKITGLIFDLKHKKSWKEITDKYNI